MHKTEFIQVFQPPIATEKYIKHMKDFKPETQVL